MSIARFNSKLIDTVELVKLSKKGIGIKLFEEIVKSSDYTIKEWSKLLHITERTILRYKKENRKFESLQSDRTPLLMLAPYQGYNYALSNFS